MRGEFPKRETFVAGFDPKALISAREFFEEMLGVAYGRCRIRPEPAVTAYLVELLSEYIRADAFFSVEPSTEQRKQPTRAELLLEAMATSGTRRLDILKRLGDTSLYVAGFFGESLTRKTVDLDYYMGMGAVAYDSLASALPDQEMALVYDEFAQKFLNYVDVLTVVSQKCLVQTDTNLLSLYERYIRTGSELAREHLLEKGLIPYPRVANGGYGDQ